MVKRGYGYLVDIEDDRDHLFKLARTDEMILPNEHDLTASFPPPMDQGQFGTCTVHGVTAAIRYNLINTDRDDVLLSRAQLYWDAGEIEGDTGDVGRQIRDVVKAAEQLGVAPESLWGYDKIGVRPNELIYNAAAQHMATEYCRVEINRASINTALFVGHPVIIGIPVYKQFESDEAAATGVIAMPGALDTEVGMHCMLLGGYGARDKVLNSWGNEWGDKGYCYLPNGYLEKYGSDLWTILMDN